MTFIFLNEVQKQIVNLEFNNLDRAAIATALGTTRKTVDLVGVRFNFLPESAKQPEVITSEVITPQMLRPDIYE